MGFLRMVILMDLVGGVLQWAKSENNWSCFDHRRRQYQCIQKQNYSLEEKIHKNSSNMASSCCNISPIMSIFVWFLFVSTSSVCPVLSLESGQIHKANQTFRPGEEVNKLKNIRAHLMKINKPALKTIKSPDGDLIDCVLAHQQPAFDHPQLKGQKPLDPPERPNGHNPTGMVSEDYQQWSFLGESCPQETIPIRRTTEKDLLRASSITTFGRKLRKPVQRDSSTNGHE